MVKAAKAPKTDVVTRYVRRAETRIGGERGRRGGEEDERETDA